MLQYINIKFTKGYLKMIITKNFDKKELIAALRALQLKRAIFMFDDEKCKEVKITDTKTTIILKCL